ncbi:NUDIX domain-containing protein [Lentisphaerota bacterium ZTH]|nr:NUDIX domain-containing protein [Lentisphaerota bacterium]WET05656.1 NUDIX domain-containing protein [Lentisphaerota bacterium ZTH]
MSRKEHFEVYDEKGKKIGLALRCECHGNPKLLHHTAHVVIFHPDGRILLQKRSKNKDIQPGKWDTAVGGHVMPGEDSEAAARREMNEELGLPLVLPLTYLFESKIRNEIESEDVKVYGCIASGPFEFQKSEIDKVRFFTSAELKDTKWRRKFTPNLLEEIDELFKRDLIYK